MAGGKKEAFQDSFSYPGISMASSLSEALYAVLVFDVSSRREAIPLRSGSVPGTEPEQAKRAASQ